MVTSFHEYDECCRISPGMKDFISVQNSDGTKAQKRKQLVLCNLNELYEKLKDSHPDANTGFSKFCELHPKWCVSGSPRHTLHVNVCCIHHNVKMMTYSAKITTT
jgi:hypothetical protein